MIYLQFDENNKVTFQHNIPKILPLDMLDKGILVNDIPPLETIKGKEAILKINYENIPYWEYFDSSTDIPIIPEPVQPTLATLSAEIDALKASHASTLSSIDFMLSDLIPSLMV